MCTYFRRAVKYFIQLIVLFVILFSFMHLTGTAADNGDQSISQILMTQRGLLLAIAVVVLSLLYPRFGFVSRTVQGTDREQIIKAFAVSGFVPMSGSNDNPNEIVFHADNLSKKIFTLWEDKITVTINDKETVVSGIRKEVVKIEFRLKAFLQNDENK